MVPFSALNRVMIILSVLHHCRRYWAHWRGRVKGLTWTRVPGGAALSRILWWYRDLWSNTQLNQLDGSDWSWMKLMDVYIKLVTRKWYTIINFLSSNPLILTHIELDALYFHRIKNSNYCLEQSEWPYINPNLFLQWKLVASIPL